MPSNKREQGESEYYHVIARGVNQGDIFHDRADRIRFLETLQTLLQRHGARVDAWCLMNNHYHLLMKGKLENLSALMKELNSSYALYFNKKYQRVGHLFQGRFKSYPVESDEYYLTVLRYIHHNPQRAGICPCDTYPWSSYRSYIRQSGLAQTDFALSLLGGVGEFVRFHRTMDKDISRIPQDEKAREQAQALLQGLDPLEIAYLDPEARDKALRILKDAHISIRQIERITGISRSSISRAG